MLYLENRATLDGLLIPVFKSKPYMEDIENIQFQTNQLHDVANDTVAPNDAENRANNDNINIVHMRSNREVSEEQKHKIVEIDIQERRRGKNYEKSKAEMEY